MLVPKWYRKVSTVIASFISDAALVFVYLFIASVFARADPARKFRGGDFSNIWQSSVSWQSSVFPNCKNSWWKTLLSWVLGGAIAPIATPWIRPCAFVGTRYESKEITLCLWSVVHLCLVDSVFHLAFFTKWLSSRNRSG